VRKLVAVAALGAGLFGLGSLVGAHADVLPAGVEGCVATNPGQNVANPGGPAGSGNVVSADHCSYTATRTAGYATAAQGWTVNIYNNNSAQKTLLASYSSAAGSNPCNTAPIIQIGNYVEVSVTGGVAAVGNPFPAASDGVIPPSSDGCTSPA
jgi:hypothetical protein